VLRDLKNTLPLQARKTAVSITKQYTTTEENISPQTKNKLQKVAKTTNMTQRSQRSSVVNVESRN